MTWDLRGAMLKKAEFESARLAEFDYRWRARTMRLLAGQLDPALSPDEMAAETARRDDGRSLPILPGAIRRAMWPGFTPVAGPMRGAPSSRSWATRRRIGWRDIRLRFSQRASIVTP